MNRGVELEYWVVNDRGALCDGRELASAHEWVIPEFVPSLIEIRTPPFADETVLPRMLYSVLRPLLDAAEANDKRLVPLGTPLTTTDMQTTSERGKLLERIYGEALTPAKHCAGTHIHFERNEPTRQLNLLTALDPALALLSSSPCYDGTPRMTCSRAHAYRTGCGAKFSQYRALWKYTPDLQTWEQRLDTAYANLKHLAADCGITERSFREQFCPEDAVNTPVRLRRSIPTVEWRAPDTTLPSQVIQLVTDISRLMQWTNDRPVVIDEQSGILPDRICIPEFSKLEQLSSMAIKQGLDSSAVRAYLRCMTLDPTAYCPLTARMTCPSRVSESVARRARLYCANLLERDVAMLVDSDHPREPYVLR
jgi:hypothetical protein